MSAIALLGTFKMLAKCILKQCSQDFSVTSRRIKAECEQKQNCKDTTSIRMHKIFGVL